MKIGIITFCEAVNYGAYLQAFCLGEYFSKKGHDVSYISTSSFKQKYWQFHNLYSYHLDRMKFRNEFRKKYLESKKKLKIVHNKKGYDLVVIGSDEMWQLNGQTFTTKPEYWGMNIDADTIITYAVCSNGTKIEDIDKYPFIKEGLQKIKDFSVRDEMTFDTFLPILPKRPHKHVDPTFMVDLNDYVVPMPINDNYILIYTYGFNEEKIKKTIEFAKLKNLKMIAVGNKFDWCDYSIPASPFEFLGLIKNAKYVVTDTFHGTVLSTHFHKEFFTFANEKEKVLQFIREYGLEQRNASDVSNLESIAVEKTNYEFVDSKIDDVLEQSKNYLTSYLVNKG